MSRPRNQKKRVLVYLFGSLGDTLVAIPALRAIRRSFQDAEIVLLQNKSVGGVVEASEVIPAELVDRYVSYNAGTQGSTKLMEFLGLWRSITKERFHAAVYLVISERSSRSVSRDRLFFHSCGIKRLIGFHALTEEQLYPRDLSGHPSWTESESEKKFFRLELDGIDVDRSVDVEQPTIDLTSIEKEEARSWLLGRRTTPNARLVAMAPGCKTKANQWPIANFESLGNRLIHELGREIVIVGGKGEAALGDQLIESWGSGINAAGQFSVIETAAVLSQCNEYVGLDTGTTHLAAAVGSSCFAIYGERNNPGHWFPMGDGHTIIWHRVECAGCRAFECPVAGHPCITGIDVDRVWEHYKEYADRISNEHCNELRLIDV